MLKIVTIVCLIGVTFHLLLKLSRVQIKHTPIGHTLNMTTGGRRVSFNAVVDYNTVKPTLVDELVVLHRKFTRTHDFSLFLDMAEKYAKGDYPRYKPDTNCAIKLLGVAAKCSNPEIVALSLSKYMSLRNNSVSLYDRAGYTLPNDICLEMCRNGDQILQILKYERLRRSVGKAPVAKSVHVPKKPPVQTVVERVLLKEDKQSSHDHSISSTLKKNIRELKVEFDKSGDSFVEDPIEFTLQKIRGNDWFSDKDISKIFNILVLLNTSSIESIGCSQLDVLQLVLWRIKKISDDEVKDNLYETLGKNILSSFERDHSVCVTGRILRIISTLDGVEEIAFNRAMPMDVVKNEIATLSSKIREDTLGKISGTRLELYNTVGDDDLSKEMSLMLKNEVHEVYVKNLGLNQKILGPIVELYAEVF